MRSNLFKSVLIKSGIAASALWLASGAALAQQQVNLTAAPTTATLSDGTSVPMWGYSCTALATGVTSTATCAPLNPAAALLGQWSPVVITVPTGAAGGLQINLTNNLSFTPTGATTANTVPTSLTIVGQLGGGLGTGATATPSPTHDAQGVTWSTANTGVTNVPPPQGPRVRSLATEVTAGATVSLAWTNLRPGTYLIESGTHPSIQGPMGLYGILVVTAPPSSTSATGTAYPGVSYNAEIPLLLSEIDPLQNNAVSTAVNTVGFVESATHGPMVGSAIASFTVTNGGSGYTSAPSVVITGGGGTGATATAVVAGGAVTGVTLTSGGTGYAFPPNVSISGGGGTGAKASAVLTLQSTQARLCGGAAACYPPAVNYTPLYYLVNGAAFDKTNPANSLFAATSGTSTVTPVTGNVLVRLVNAGLRMHVPSIVGSQTTPLTVPTGVTAAAVPGFSLIAEDGNPLPGITRVQSEVFMAAGKTYDVMVNVPAAGSTPLPVYDRELSLSGNAINRDAGMLAYVGVNGAALPATGVFSAANTAVQAVADTYNAVIAGQTLTVSDPSKGVLANDINVSGAKVVTGGVACTTATCATTGGLVALAPNGTFTYTPNSGTTSDSFTYCGNGTTSGAACATVTLGAASLEASNKITCTNSSFTSTVATTVKISPPGILAGCTDAAGYPLTVNAASVAGFTGLSVDANGGFTILPGGHSTFTFKAQNSQGVVAANAATVTVNFPVASGLVVNVVDGANPPPAGTTCSSSIAGCITDYRWIIEEDKTFFVDPACTTNPLPSTCPTVATVNGSAVPAVFGTNFHTSHVPTVATGCTGPLSCEGGQTVLGSPAVCDVGNGVCRPDTTGNGFTAVTPDQVHLDPTKRYYISVFPGDAAQPFISGYAGAPDCSTTGVAAGHCGHGMGGAPIAKAQTAVTVLTQPSPYPPAKLTVFVFEDDYPLNGEHDAGGGIDVLSPQEPGLGGFQITLDDSAGATGDPTGTPTYDMFNQPLSNSLAGTIDPVTGFDACPISTQVTANVQQLGSAATPAQCALDSTQKGCQKGITGMIVTCPKYESDGKTLSPLAGQAVIANLYPGRYGVIAQPGADRIARGEEWLQTNTLDGQKAHDSFLRIGEPAYFQEFGPAGYHVSIGFANPKIINDRLPGLCPTPASCTNELKGHVTTARMSRTPDERLYGSGDRSSFAFTQCYASLGDPDGADFAFVKCDKDGNFDFKNIPGGNFKLTLFDQWNDQIVDGISTPVGLAGQSGVTLDMGEVAAHQWQANFFTRTFIDSNGDGVSQPSEPGLALVKTNVRYRDGSISNRNNTDLNGYAAFNEEFPLFNWYVIETDVTRYKNTGTHIVYDAGGPTDGTTACGSSANSNKPCGGSTIAAHYANTYEPFPLPSDLSVPGAVYCAEGADCGTSAASFAAGTPIPSSLSNHSTGRIDPPWVLTEGWQGFSGQNNFLEFGKKPYVPKENGGIRGHVVYSSTRPFDDPQFGTQNVWEPLVPNVTVNLYQEGVAADGVTPTLTLVDTTQTSSFDAWAQGFYPGATAGTGAAAGGKPYMSCPGQSATVLGTASYDPFYWGGLINQPNYLDWYNSQHGGSGVTMLPYNSQYKCYDGMHNWNQLQPAPYDGMYQFPSVTAMDPVTGKPVAGATNCKACVPNPDTTDQYRSGTPMLPDGKYVVEVVVPPGYVLTKEEDKNILIGDNFIAPVTQQFGGLGNVFILPDQASIAASYNSNSAQNPTNSLGRAQNLTSHEGDTPTVNTFWPCVGASRTVPDYISLFPQSKQVAPFAGATRNLCDRKEVTLDDQTSAQAEFFVWTPTHIASKFTGQITDDFSAEFDPFSPQFGEKFAPAYLPVSVKDWAGNETNRIISDQWGAYNGLSYSTWEVNPPNPTGYAPTMMVTCMNDAGTGATPDPFYQPGYSQFCYELAFMPGQTGYFDTPVVPTSSHSEGYNHPDCSYPDATPAIASVTGDVAGPWVKAAGSTLTINALGDQLVDNYGYSGPVVNTSTYLWATQKITRHYGFLSTQGTGSVTIGGINAVVNSWSDTSITVTVPSGVPNCAVQQQAQYFGTATVYGTAPNYAQCGQLVITAANGKQSIDTVTVTIGGKTPTVFTASATTPTIQSAIDVAQPGDMIIVPAGKYNEMLQMWKPVRLQGVGAASAIIDASTHPAGKLLDPWRRRLGCLFGLTPDGRPRTKTDNSCATGWTAASGGPNFPSMIVDRLPFEAVLGWDTTINGNLAEQLIEPSVMGAYEGAAITVLGKGVNLQASDTDPFGAAVGSAYSAGTTLLLAGDCGPNTATATNPYPGNFYCNPSSIDGLGVKNSSQGGGGIFVHAFAHGIQIANNRVHNNTGTLTGGITIGQGEHPDVALAPADPTTLITYPGPCENSTTTGLALPFCFDMNVNVHHNSVTLNSSMGDELFSSTPAGAGGVSICTGSDYYKFNYNWVCGNMSTGDGGGVAHIGWSKNGDIEHNTIIFNQSANPTITTNGGGLLVMGAPDVDPPCAALNDKDCLSPAGTVPPSDGTGVGLVINANLILGNSADSGSGGGLRLQHINGNDVLNFPNGATQCKTPGTASCLWNSVTVTNNIITNNVAGWDGGGVSLIDALAVNIINNTIASNDSTASAGPLFGSLFAPLASTPGVNCTTTGGIQSCPQVAGLVSVTNSDVLQANLPTTGITCPPGHGTSGSCSKYSVPLLANNVIWQNRSFVIGVGNFGTGTLSNQRLVTLYNSAFNGATATVPAASQPKTDATTASGGGVIITGGTGACVAASYWDIGVRGDLGPANHVSSTLLLAPTYSVLTDATDYPGANNSPTAPGFVSQYCNGSRVPPELGSMGYTVNPGTNELNALPNPVFSLQPSATVDEGNNWINLRWGPLALVSPLSTTGAPLGNYALATTSPVINTIPTSEPIYSLVPRTDFFGNARPETTADTTFDPGAVEFGAAPAVAVLSVTGGPLAFGNQAVGYSSAARTLTLHNTGPVVGTAITLDFGSPSVFSRAGGTCGTTLAAGATCTINVVFTPTAVGAASGTLTIFANVAVAGSPVALSGTGVADVVAARLTPATWTISHARNCPGTGILGILACALDPAQVFTLTNTGNVPLTGITQGVLGGTAANVANYSVVRLFSTCGPAGGGQLLGQTTLAPGAACVVTVQFKPLTSQGAGSKPATISVTDLAGTQTSALNGTAQ
jgi:hypothetical protein